MPHSTAAMHHVGDSVPTGRPWLSAAVTPTTAADSAAAVTAMPRHSTTSAAMIAAIGTATPSAACTGQ